MQVELPVGRDPVARARRGLVDRVRGRRGELGPVDVPFGAEVPEPGLTGLEAAHDRVPGLGRVRTGMLGRRGVAAPDVPALGAAAQVEPPPAGVLALCAAGAAGWHRGIDVV